MLSNEFKPGGTYLDTATYGLPATTALSRLAAVTAAWSEGRYDPADCDAAVASARSAFARLHRVSPADVAIGHQVSPNSIRQMPSASRSCEVLRERLLDVTRRLVSECGRNVTLHEVAEHARGQDAPGEAIVDSLLEQRLGDLVDVVRLADWRPPARASGWTRAVRELVSSELDLSLREAARALAVSVRTLQRRLADEGTSWRAEIDAARKERAAQLLQQGTAADLAAAQVGYSGSRALRRARRRWDSESG